MTEDFGYLIEPLRGESGFTLYRGRDLRSSEPILALAAAVDQPSLQSLQRLEHEMSLAPELNTEWAAQPLALTRRLGQTILVMKDPGGEPLDCLIARYKEHPLNVTRLLRIAIGLAAALSGVHRQGLIHKDVKPANALVNDSGHVWLTGFGIASRLPRERLSPVPPEIIAGTLAYMSPEQTGRMNRSIDSRSDLYSLGVTLYEMFTGELPFTGSDPMEWVHCHLARRPLSPVERTPGVPYVVSSIIMKLLARTAEARYQTAVGLGRDLQRCLGEWETHGHIDEFPLGQCDMPDRLRIPEKLYGREAEIDTLLASFDRVVGGSRPELVLVSGFSGVGKSSVVNELHKALVPPRGYFASGKFDQYKRDIPYATLAEAFRGLIRPILAKSEEEVGHWRDEIVEALGPNGQLMIDLVPELKLVIGEQEPVPELPAQDALNRLKLVFRRFVGVFTRNHPLALFLDDLQWLDAGTLDLMEELLTHAEVKGLMLVGAYRDNEVTSAHPLMRKLEKIRQAGTLVHDIVLAPLGRTDLEELVADSLHCERLRASSLAELLEEKTDGNPFFAIQFLSALAEESLLTFDYGEGKWSWDLNRIRMRGYTDNVVDLMVRKLDRLSTGAQKALQELACLGISADLAALRMASERSNEELLGQLSEALQAGLVSRSQDIYSFVHDRVQEAAYSLIPQKARAEAHLRIGMLMASHTSPEKLEEVIFEIANHLNRGAHLVTSMDALELIARLNLIAGRRAKKSTAYAAALTYLHAGRASLSASAWEHNYDLIFSIESLLAECEMMTSDTDAAEDRLCKLTDRVKSAHDIALITRLRLTLYDLTRQTDRGLQVFIEYQRGRGLDWSAHPSDEEVSREYDRIWSLLGGRNIEELVDLPLVTDSDLLDELAILTEFVMQAMHTSENLLAFVLCRTVCISLEHGNSDAACFAYVSLGMLAGPRFSNYEAGFQLGKLGYDLVEKRGLSGYQARVYLRFGSNIIPWKHHIRAGREVLRRAFEAANKIGDLTYAAYSFTNINANLLAAGDRLMDVQRDAESGLEFAERMRFDRAIIPISIQLAFVRNLRGLTSKFGTLGDGHFDDLQFEVLAAASAEPGLLECFYWVRKLQACYFAGDYGSAMHASTEAAPLLWATRSFFETAEYHFYGALARAASFDSAIGDSRWEHRKALADHHAQLTIWAESSRETFEDRFLLVSAEIARIEALDLDAMRLYEQAIDRAKANGFLHNEAIAHELAGRFYLSRNIETAGYAYIRKARNCYDRWGAIGKVKQLDEQYPRHHENGTQIFAAGIGEPTERLDVEAVMKAVRALSSEMILPSLIETLMRISMEHAGAERGVLIQIAGGVPTIEAEALTAVGKIEVAVGQKTVSPFALLQSVLHYVIRTRESVILDDASSDNAYSKDEYVQLRGCRSVLCLPVIKQGTLVGALYLENNLASRVFTPSRVAVLQLLTSQAAISIENATLFTDLQRSETFMALGQYISHTGSFGWTGENGQYYWSEGIYNILEYDRGVRASAEAALQRIHFEDRDLVRRLLDDASREKRAFDIEHRLMMPDGRIKYVHVTGRAVDTGSLDFVGAVRDITERKQAEATLRQALSDLARVNRVTAMGELTASLAHEVNQPIAAVIANADASLRWLSRDRPDIVEARKATERIVAQGQRASQIIRGIRAQFQKEAANQVVSSIGEIIQETVGLLRGEALRFNVSMRTELATGLPQFVGDRLQLQQVVMNLIINGIEAMKDVDGIRAMVIKAERAQSGQILVSVSDTGIGVPPQLVEQIFDPFFTTKPGGTGMGLRICRSIIETHGGQLWVAEETGQGTTFQFTLPVTAESAPDCRP
ncbi:AAA family ATPase [Paraburkholderia sp. BR10923]|uniref:trifunctional serine/threonine-protein kinase/ATP-binding protein/sensor histidine kinase n=1 Tax=Paraburkholderia sp. BR10923 TaxID=3236992 RepID=UPI0034CDD51C